MVFFKKTHIIRRYHAPVYTQGHMSVPYEDIRLEMDVQEIDDAAKTDADGTNSTQELEVFCDSPILTEDDGMQQKADRLWYRGKWFSCRSSILSENTILRHYTAVFVECLDKEEPPKLATAVSANTTGSAEGGGMDDAGRG